VSAVCRSRRHTFWYFRCGHRIRIPLRKNTGEYRRPFQYLRKQTESFAF